MRRIIIVGGTDGLGRELVFAYAVRGFKIAVLGRSPLKLQKIQTEATALNPTAEVIPVLCDLYDSAQIEPAFEEALKRLGHSDLVIYAAGVMIDGDGKFANTSEDSKMLQVNTVAAIQFLGLAANYFVLVRRGHLVGISSIAGERARKGNPAYCASKAALNAYLEGLRNRLVPLGVIVSTVKPGYINTRMLQGRVGLPWVIEPYQAARMIVRKLDAGAEVFYVPGRWSVVGAVVRWMPSFLFKRFGPP